MRVICNLSKPLPRSFSAFVALLLCVSGLGLFTASLQGQTKVALSQVFKLGTFPNGGVQSSGNYAGTAIVVNQQGNIIAAEPNGNDVVSFNPTTGVSTVIAPGFTNVGTVALDPQNNLYISTLYDSGQNIVKVPYVNGAYVAVTAPSSSTPACVGSDTAECYVPNLTDAADGYYIQIRTMTFDAAGDLFIGTGEDEIIECAAYCLGAGPTLLYKEPAGTSMANSDGYTPGALALDTNGNLFFTTSDFYANGATNYVEYSYVSNLKELVYTPGTGYAATPILLDTYTPATVGSGSASDEITGLAVANNTIYFTTLYDGIFAFTDTAGVVTPATPYAVSTQGGKALGTNGLGQFYVDSTASGDPLMQINIGNIALPSATVGGTASTASDVTVILNDGTCASPETISFAGTGTDGGDFTATAGTTCTSTLLGGSSYPATVTFNPTGSGNETGTLTATSSGGDSGSAKVSGLAITVAGIPTFSPAAGTYTAVQTVTLTSTTKTATIYYTTDGTTPTTSSSSLASGGTVTVSVTETLKAYAVATGLSDSAVATAAYVINIPVASTPAFSVASGTYQSVLTVTLSSASPGATIYYTTDGVTVPTTASKSFASGSTITVAASETVMAFATAPGYTTSAVGSASYVIVLPAPAASTPTISPKAGQYMTAQTVTLTSTTAGATIYYTTDGVTIPNIGSPTIASGSTITVSASETVMASALAPGYTFSPVATAVYTIGVITQSFSVSIDPPALTVNYGGSGAVTVSVTPAGQLTSPVSFACSGLPSGTTCAFSPTTVTTAGTVVSTTKLTLTPPATAAAIQRNAFPFFPGGTVAAAALCMLGLRKRRRLQVTLMLMLGVVATSLVVGCSSGGSGSTTTSTTPTATTVTVTATSGSISNTATFSLTVQ